MGDGFSWMIRAISYSFVLTAISLFLPWSYVSAAESRISGKGVIYYTENYLRSYTGPDSKYDLPIPDPPGPHEPITGIDTAYVDSQGAYTFIRGNRYWYRQTENSSWFTDQLSSAYTSSPAADPPVPTEGIDSAYFDNAGGYTVIKADRYWYHATPSTAWTTATLASAYGTSGGTSPPVPTSAVDAAYFDTNGGYTVIKADRYWYRQTADAPWYTNTLASAYATSPNAATAGVPTSGIDAAYFDRSGGYTVVRDGLYWYRATPSSPWYSDMLTRAYRLPLASLRQGAECSRYIDLTDHEMTLFKNLGLNYVIVGFGPAAWYNVETADGVYRFDVLDQWIGRLQMGNIGVVLQLWGTPTWASGAAKPDANGCQNNPYRDFAPYNRKPVNPAAFADFVERVMRRYDGLTIANPMQASQKLLVSTVSLWNEPNLSDFWSGTPGEYLALNNLAYDRIKAVRPDVIVWGGNLLGNSNNSESFLDAVSGQLKFDVFALHAYPANFNAPPTDSSNRTRFAIGNLAHARAVLDATPAYRDKPIALTEIGYRSDWEHQFGVNDITISETTKASYLRQSLEVINTANAAGAKITAATNNVLYNPWRWWSTGLVNYYNAATGQVDFSETLPAYSAFQSWSLTAPTPTPTATPVPGDLTGDGHVTIDDIRLLVSDWMQYVQGINAYGLIVSNYGK